MRRPRNGFCSSTAKAAISSSLDLVSDSRQRIAAAPVRSRIEHAHDPETWKPVFGQDHAQKRILQPMTSIASRLLLLLLLAVGGPGLAQEQNPAPAPAQNPPQDPDTLDPTPPGSLNPAPLPPLLNPNASTPAKDLFGRKPMPFPGPARSIGSY